jgi:excisionase family DNA binding protein
VDDDLRLLKLITAADLLGIGLTKMYELVNSGQIRRVELGTTQGNQRIRATDLASFIEARTFGPKP